MQNNFFETLADLLKSGFSLKQSIQNISILYPKMANDLEKISVQLNQGRRFSACIQKFVSNTTYNQIAVAEEHGQLERSVVQLGKYLRGKMNQKEKLIGVLIYPILLIFLLTMMIFIFAKWLNPTLASINFNNQKNFFDTIYYQAIKTVIICIILGGIVYSIRIIFWWKKQKQITRHIWYSQLPLIGNVYRNFSYYYLSFNLALLLKNGMNLQEVCLFLGRFSQNSLMYQLGEDLRRHLLEGKKISSFIRKYPFLPPELVIFFNKGQTNAELSQDLLIYSQTTYQRLMRSIDNLINLVQPLSFLVIAIIIIVIYLSILIPMYSNLGGVYQ